MKYQNKIQFFFFILAAVILCGQGLGHSVFHAHAETRSCYSQSTEEFKTKYSAGIKHTDNSTQDIFLKNICPICSSIASKSIPPVDAETQLNRISLTYSQPCESFSFNFYGKPASRGPPAFKNYKTPNSTITISFF